MRYPFELYNERIATHSQESFALRFNTILEKSMIQLYLMGVTQIVYRDFIMFLDMSVYLRC